MKNPGKELTLALKDFNKAVKDLTRLLLDSPGERLVQAAKAEGRAEVKEELSRLLVTPIKRPNTRGPNKAKKKATLTIPAAAKPTSRFAHTPSAKKRAAKKRAGARERSAKGPQSCATCGEPFLRLTSHYTRSGHGPGVKLEIDVEEEKKKAFPCDFCPDSFDREDSLNLHASREH